MNNDEHKERILEALKELIAEGKVKTENSSGETRYYLSDDKPLEKVIASGELIKIFDQTESYASERYAPPARKDLLDISTKAYTLKKQRLLNRFNSLL